MNTPTLIIFATLALIASAAFAGCSHDHPLTDHHHDHEHEYTLPVHDHNNLFTLGLPYTYIVSVDPPLSEYNIVPTGYLTNRLYGKEIVYIRFNRPAENLMFTNVEYPHLYTTRVSGVGYEENRIYRASVRTDCSDPEHTGYIAFRITWDTGSGDTGTADFIYKCPEEE